MAIHWRSKKVRQELWVALCAVCVLAVGVLAWNASHSDPAAYLVQSGIIDKTATGTPAAESQKPAETKAPAAQAPQPNDVYSVTARTSDTSSFASLLANTGLSSLLKTAGPFSVFVPTNAALKLANTPGMSAEDRKRFAEYHIISGRAVDIDAVRAGNVMSLSGDHLNFVVIGDEKLERVNSSRILETQRVGNGIIYVIDAPLFPPKRPF